MPKMKISAPVARVVHAYARNLRQHVTDFHHALRKGLIHNMQIDLSAIVADAEAMLRELASVSTPLFPPDERAEAEKKKAASEAAAQQATL